MLINTRWLLEYLSPGCTHAQVLDALPRAGLEVEASHDLRAELSHVRIGFVRAKKPIAGAPGMHACTIEVERGRMVPVVCASEHPIEVGWGVPVALAGTKLPTGASIGAGKFHAEPSEGMICLDGEMGLLAQGAGLHVFHDESALGKPFTSLVDVQESLADINVLPNRPDCLGMIGIAREVAALTGATLVYPARDSGKLTVKGEGASGVPVEIQAPELCARYACRLVRGIKVAPSPHWLKSRLLAVGFRPRNNIVDITNFVLYEWGQPLHAFDFARVRGGRIVVRAMKPGETLELLGNDAQRGRVLDASRTPLVIADAERPLALAGIKGGHDSGTTDATTDVLIESACFDPVNIRRTVRAIDVDLGSRGPRDASYHFERGVDPNFMLIGALERATALMTELGGGRVAGPATDVYPRRIEPRSFSLTPERVSAYLGTPVGGGTILDSLRRLEMVCTDDLAVTVPTWRVDVNDPVVLIEDVARLIGYDSIPMRATPAMPTTGIRCVADRVRQAVTEHLAAIGWLEARNPSLESPDAVALTGPLDARLPIAIANAATRDMSVVRRSLLPGLMQSAERNLRRGASTVRLFEIDRTFWLDRPGGEPKQRWMVAGICAGAVLEFDWRSHAAKTDFFHLKGAVESLLDALHAPDRAFDAASEKPFAPHAAAGISAAGAPVGRLGELAPGLVDTGKLPLKLYAFELDLDALQAHFLSTRTAGALPRTPPVTRDIAIVVDAAESYAGIEEEIRRSAGPALELLRLIDVYQGPQVPAGRKSLALHLLFRAPDRTLTADEISATIDAVVKNLGTRFNAELRA